MYGFRERGSSNMTPGYLVDVDCGSGLSAEVSLISWLQFGIWQKCTAQVW